MKSKADLLIHNTKEVITCVSNESDPLGRITDGALVIGDGSIMAVGKLSDLKKTMDLSNVEQIDAQGKIVAPGFVDCHTHLIFGGSRGKEFALKMTKSMDEIKSLGIHTGIPASIRMTREASDEELYLSAMDRLGRMLSYGTTTVESKSGYGINLKDELKQLYVNRRLSITQPVEVVSTFLGAHDFPLEIDRDNQHQRDGYIQSLIQDMIPCVAEEELAQFCDIYCDEGYYTRNEAELILKTGLDYGLQAKIHTDAYANIGGSTLAADLPCISADHLNYTSKPEMSRLAASGVIGVVLPALDFAMAHPNPFNPRKMLDAGMTLALGSNLNPGNWTESMQFVMQLACRNHGMSLEEAMLASTVGAAKAIKREHLIGCLSMGYQADIQIWNLACFEDLIYRIANNAVWKVIKKGQVVIG
jgi:imidazolonepropionase